jgi:peptidoglycan hydrolase-like protein with peptidoglycan-binding domain
MSARITRSTRRSTASAAASAVLVATLVGVAAAPALGAPVEDLGAEVTAAEPDVTGPTVSTTGTLAAGVWTVTSQSQDEDVAAWWYSLDGGSRTLLAADDARHAQVVLTDLALGPHTVTVYARDTAGNESSSAWTFEVEAPVAPGPRLSVGTSLGHGVPTFSMQTLDQDVAVWTYSLDGGPVTAIADADARRAELRLPGLAAGNHTLTIYATDAAGRTSEQSVPFIAVDPEPDLPGPRIGSGGGPVDGVWTFGYEGEEEDIVRWTYSLDGSPAAEFAPIDARRAELRFPGLRPGVHTVTVWAENGAGEVAEVVWPFEVENDGTGPRLSSGGGLVDGVWTFGYESEDRDVAVWSYSLDDGPVTVFAGTDARHAELALPGLAAGRHVVTVWATDGSGGVSEVSWPFEVVAAPDTAGPQLDTTRTFEDGAWVFRYRTTDEDAAAWSYRVDRGPQQPMTGTDARSAELRLSGLQPGPHDVEIWVSDAAGNVTWYRWVFDVAAPSDPTPVPTPAPAPAPAPVVTPRPTTPAPVAAPALAADAIPAARLARGIARGATGPSVSLIQGLVGATVDGRFGPQTAAAVRAFQRAHGLVPDGVVGPLTWAALVDVANGGTGRTSVTSSSVPRAVILRGVAQGAHGQAVVTIQRLVGAAPDGRFGPQTRSAVQAWQRTHGLVPDGVVGPLTWAALTSSR